jgi:hypothetical protein
MPFSQDTAAGVFIFFFVTSFAASLIFSYYATKKFARLNRFLMYALPLPLVFLGIIASLIPGAYVAGSVFGVTAVYKLPAIWGVFAFSIFSMIIGVAFAWAIAYPVFNLLHKKQGNAVA